tara:strand:+ start:3228 stop:3869 length:642 start_codon:yes stop_codon:yes gene_type:complete
MGDEGFGVMDLLQKLFKEREQTGGAKGAVSDQEFKTLQQGGSELPDSLKGLKTPTNFLSKGGMSDAEFNRLSQGSYGGDVNRTNQLSTINNTSLNNTGAVSNNEILNLIEKSKISGRPEGRPSQQTMIKGGSSPQTSYGGSAFSDAEMTQMQPMNDVDAMFAQELQNMNPQQANEVIMMLQNYTPDQQQNFKAQYLSGNVPQYELEAQSNLGF